MDCTYIENKTKTEDDSRWIGQRGWAARICSHLPGAYHGGVPFAAGTKCFPMGRCRAKENTARLLYHCLS